MQKDASTMEKVVALCKRRGFIFPSSEIYGGIGGFWDYGPLGVEFKRNVKEAWWRDMVSGHDDTQPPTGAPSSYEMVGIDSTIITHPQVWKASGHFDLFYDLFVDCKTCKARFRADQVKDSQCPKKPSKHPGAGGECALTDPREFNLMFKTYVGALIDPTAEAYLRPETAQGIFLNFKNVVSTSRVKIPFGIAQIGKSFRNEITPRNFTFRSREFEQMEIEFFCAPEESQAWYQYWRDRRMAWYVSLGLASDRLRLREHSAEERAHYSCGTADIEYAFPFCAEGDYGELEGVSHRSDFDLRSHMEGKLVKDGAELVVERDESGAPRRPGSGKDLSYFDEATQRKFVPHVIEPSAGADRAALAFLCEAYDEDSIPDENGVPQERVVLHLHPRLAPVKVAVFPLVKKDGQPETAADIYRTLKQRWNVFYDEKGSIGKRYRRQDESGTPFCVTVDHQTAQDGTVTVRERDTTTQTRVAMRELEALVAERLRAA